MNWTGRISTAAAASLGIISHLFCVYGYINTFAPVAISDHRIPIEIKFWDTKRTPQAHMVDVTNQFGLKVLAEHNFLNDNNIAFSPYGLMGILVALYEGVDGESSYQIQRSMQLPWNRNIMRIGFRDIHRTLKTYFAPEEGFLAGLALNNENITFTESYKKILRFYGFDLPNEPAPTLKPQSDNTTTEDTSTVITTLQTPLSTIENTMREDSVTPSQPTDMADQTTNPSTETTTNNNPTTTVVSAVNTEPVTQITDIIQTTPPSTISFLDDSSTTPTTTLYTTQPSSSSIDDSTINSDVEVISTISTDTTASASSTQNMESTTMMAETQESTTNMEATTELSTQSTLETLERKKKSIVDFIFTRPPYIEDYEVYRSFQIGPDLPEGDLDSDHMFLVNGLRNIQVSYMHYDTILDYAYLHHLEATALRLPLDSDRYYLLIVLPLRTGAGELSKLLGRMARESDLSDVHEVLRPRRVRAIVPSFTVKGHVILTTDLQKLGIRDVFEPRQSDFSPLTHQRGVYVRSIEQAVSVAIRKYQPDTAKDIALKRSPVIFSATYPFLYFVMDSSIHVALMAGKMVDPLNTRIL